MGERVVNWSISTADRPTHLKIAAIGLAIPLLITAAAVVALQCNVDITSPQTGGVVKAGTPIIVSDRNVSVIR
jgi:hypothetical protein